MKDPNDERFQKINLSNNAYQKRVGQVIGGKVILNKVGFSDDIEDGFLVMNEPNMKRIKEFLDEINLILERMN